MIHHPCRVGVFCAATLLAAGGAGAATTGFESFDEDFYGFSFTADGITFQNAFSEGDQRTFAVDDAGQVWQDWGVTDWVSGNVLGMGAYSGGASNVTFSAIERVEMTTGRVETSAEFTFFYILEDGRGNDFTQNTMTLEALLGGEIVSSQDYTPGNQVFDSGRSTYGATRFEFEGVEFDTLRLVSEGPANVGRMVGVIDNVTIVPAPGAAVLLALAGPGLVRRRR